MRGNKKLIPQSSYVYYSEFPAAAFFTRSIYFTYFVYRK